MSQPSHTRTHKLFRNYFPVFSVGPFVSCASMFHWRCLIWGRNATRYCAFPLVEMAARENDRLTFMTCFISSNERLIQGFYRLMKSISCVGCWAEADYSIESNKLIQRRRRWRWYRYEKVFVHPNKQYFVSVCSARRLELKRNGNCCFFHSYQCL